MNLLFVIPYVPTPIRVRPYSFLKTLAAQDHHITLATLWRSNSEYEALTDLENLGINIITEQLPQTQSLWNAARTLPSRVPLQANYCYHPGLEQMILQQMRRSRFDAIHIEHLRGAQYGLNIQKYATCPVIWDSVDCISHLFAQASHHSRSLFGKWMTRLELKRTRRFEGELIARFPFTLVTSSVDKSALLALPQSTNVSELEALANKIIVLPNGVDTGRFFPGSHQRHPATLVISGKMSYHANVTMVLHLIHDIMPLVWARYPDTRVTIVGKDPPASIQKLHRDARVEVTGFVTDMQPYLSQATIAVAPMAYGAGIQNKLLEAMACQTPVVTMRQAVSALQIVPERDLLVADDAQSFAHQVCRLLDAPQHQQDIGQNGYTYVQKFHNWQRLSEQLVDIYQQAAA